ncbi:hypothetical protein [Lysinibacillus capsici]|nr:hypothetical protein [Lysinibacillus capsici]
MGSYRMEKITIAIFQKHYNEWAAKVKRLVPLSLTLKRY